MSYPIIEKFIHKNRPYTPLNARGGVIHETANLNDSDEMEQQYFDTQQVNASAHAFVDADSITQCVPWDEVSWHAGRTANRQFWGIELCNTTNVEKFKQIWDRGTWLYAYLFTNVCIPPIHTVSRQNLMSHAEVSVAWRETDHMDPISYFSRFGKTVDNFRFDVQAKINNMVNADKMYKEENDMFKDADKIPDFAKEAVNNLEHLGIVHGDTDGNYRPLDSVNRAEMAVIINNLLKINK
jgi:N-acetylmuramoyl-L-alanine amidase